MFIFFIFRRRKGGLIVRMGLAGRGVFVDFLVFLFLFFFSLICFTKLSGVK